MRIGKKINEQKEKKEGGGKGKKDSTFQTKWISVWEGETFPLGSADSLGSPWTPRQGSPLLLLYIVGF